LEQNTDLDPDYGSASFLSATLVPRSRRGARGGRVGRLVLLRIRKLKNRQLELARRNAELDQRVRERTAELSKSHAEIQQREMLFRLIFEHAPVGISWSRTDLDGRYHFNTAFRRILNLTPDAVLDDAVLEQMTHPEDRPRRAEKESDIMQGKTDSYTIEQRFLRPGVEEASGLLAVAVVRDEGGRTLQVIRILEDITPLKKAEQELARTYERLVEASRKAGMAEVATGVLHNVGNVLNSVNVSATLLLDGFRQSRVSTLSKVAARVREQSAVPGAFGPDDSNGHKVLEYLDTVTKHLASEQQRFVGELEGLRQNVEHINEVVARQQNYAELGGIEEVIAPRDVFEEAFRMNSMSYTRHNIEVVREFSAVPKIVADRHKVLQILVNLLQNAKQAVEQNAALGRKIVLRLEEAEQSVRFVVADNGIGIAPENRARIFAHGFTTRSGGHGFGLHSSANAAKEMRGTLKMVSEGLGKGATFTLQLPVADEKALAKGVHRT
jgi:PAS domain S-box-containing protein